MIFLIDYDVPRQHCEVRSFADSQRAFAVEERMRLELEYGERKVKREVVLLEAANAVELKRTHRRYFESSRELAKFPVEDAAAH